MSITIKGKQFEGDFLDAEFLDRYEMALRDYQKAVQRTKGQTFPTVGESYRAIIRDYDCFLDSVLGAGAARELFHNSGDLRSRIEAAQELSGCAKAQRKELNDLLNQTGQRQSSTTAPATLHAIPAPHGKRRRHR